MNESTIIRVQKRDRYVIISREIFDDPDLSWETLGLLGYLLSKPNDWQVRVNHLIRLRNAGRDKIRRMLRELETAGYLERRRLRRPDGTWRWECLIYEDPQMNPTYLEKLEEKLRRRLEAEETIRRQAEEEDAEINDSLPPCPENPSMDDLNESLPPCPEKPSTAEPSTAEPSTANPSIDQLMNNLGMSDKLRKKQTDPTDRSDHMDHILEHEESEEKGRSVGRSVDEETRLQDWLLQEVGLTREQAREILDTDLSEDVIVRYVMAWWRDYQAGLARGIGALLYRIRRRVPPPPLHPEDKETALYRALYPAGKGGGGSDYIPDDYRGFVIS